MTGRQPGGRGGGGGAGNVRSAGTAPANFRRHRGNVKGTPLMVDGTLYVSTPDNAWAIDARDGRELWHYYWKTRGGTHIANRGLGIWNNYLYMETPDNYLVSLDAKTGKERWNKVHRATSTSSTSRRPRPSSSATTCSSAPATTSTRPGFCSRSIPRPARCNGALHRADESRRSRARDVAQPRGREARRRAPWLPGAYDPETKLYIFGTGNPTPAYTPGRGEGDNLYTCSLVRVDVDTGKMAWHLQTSPHDTHDWDSAQTPILFDAVDQWPPAQARFHRRAQRLLLHARSRHRRAPRDEQVRARDQLGRQVDTNGTVRRDPDKDPIVPDALVSPNAGGTVNWEPPAYSPDTGLFYVSEKNVYSIFYLTDPDPRGSMGLGGKEEVERRNLPGTSSPPSIRRTATSPGAVATRALGGGGAAEAVCSPRRAISSSRGDAGGNSWPTTPRREAAVAHAASATSPTRRRPTCSTAGSICSSPLAIGCLRS